MTRILFLLSRFLDGGIDTVLIDYLRNLSRCPEYKITLAIGIGMDELEVFLSSIPNNIEVHHLVQQPSLTKWRKRKITSHLPFRAKFYDETVLAPIRRHYIAKGIKLLAKENDVIIDFDCCHYSYLKRLSVRKIAWFHFSFNEVLKQNRRRTLRIGRSLSHYDKVVTISKAMCEEGRQLFPWLDKKLCVIYNAKDPERLAKMAAEPIQDQRINEPYILAVERLEESQKDLTTLIHAYHILREDYHHEERLYLLGKGRDEQQLRDLVASLGLEDNVQFLGFFSNPYPWIQHAQLIAHSAKLEGLPTALLEALILGKLIVSTDCPTGPREILDDGKAGLLVPVGNTEAMAEALHRLLTDTDLQNDIHQHADMHKENFLFKSTRKQFDNVVTAAD